MGAAGAQNAPGAPPFLQRLTERRAFGAFAVKRVFEFCLRNFGTPGPENLKKCEPLAQFLAFLNRPAGCVQDLSKQITLLHGALFCVVMQKYSKQKRCPCRRLF